MRSSFEEGDLHVCTLSRPGCFSSRPDAWLCAACGRMAPTAAAVARIGAPTPVRAPLRLTHAHADRPIDFLCGPPSGDLTALSCAGLLLNFPCIFGHVTCVGCSLAFAGIMANGGLATSAAYGPYLMQDGWCAANKTAVTIQSIVPSSDSLPRVPACVVGGCGCAVFLLHYSWRHVTRVFLPAHRALCASRAM